MSVGVPQSTSSSSNTLYFQVQSVAASYSWVAIGTGASMSGSNMFVVYPDGSGNVTVSTRLGTGHSAPAPHDDTRFELLAGSGVEEGILTANVACYNCESWEGGEMDLEGSSTAWIAAWREGSPLETGSVEARIAQHQGRDQFRMDLGSAQLAQDANPFVTGGGSTNGGDGGNDGTDGNGDAAGDGALGTGNTGGASSAGRPVDLLLTHGVIMTVTFAFLYPLGAMMIPLVGKWYVHAGCQVVAFLMMWAGFATGYITARNAGSVSVSPSLLPLSYVLQLTAPALPRLPHNFRHGDRLGDGPPARPRPPPPPSLPKAPLPLRRLPRAHLVRPPAPPPRRHKRRRRPLRSRVAAHLHHRVRRRGVRGRRGVYRCGAGREDEEEDGGGGEGEGGVRVAGGESGGEGGGSRECVWVSERGGDGEEPAVSVPVEGTGIRVDAVSAGLLRWYLARCL